MEEHFEKQIQNALTVIKQLQLEKFVKNFEQSMLDVIDSDKL